MGNNFKRENFENLQRTIRFLETMLRASADGIIITDSTQSIIMANKAFCNIFGEGINNIIETSMFIWLDKLSSNAVECWGELEAAVFKKGTALNIEFQKKSSRGTQYLSVNASLLDKVADEERGVIVSSWRDVTVQKEALELLQESEEKFRIVANFAMDWEYWYQEEKGFIYVSPSCKLITGYSDKEFYSDPLLLEKIIHPDDLNIWNGHVHARPAKVTISPIEFKIITKDGIQRYIEHVCREIVGKSGEHLGVRGSNRDITQKKASDKNVKTLQGLLPICSACKKIRDDAGYWKQIEEYISTHSEVDFTHSICPECIKKLYPKYSDSSME